MTRQEAREEHKELLNADTEHCGAPSQPACGTAFLHAWCCPWHNDCRLQWIAMHQNFCLDREPMKPVPVNAVNLARLLRRFPNATRSRPRVCFPSRTSSHMFYMLRGVTRCHMSHVVVVHAVAPQLCSSALCVTKRCRDRDRDPRDPRDIDLGHGGHGIDGIDVTS